MQFRYLTNIKWYVQQSCMYCYLVDVRIFSKILERFRDQCEYVTVMRRNKKKMHKTQELNAESGKSSRFNWLNLEHNHTFETRGAAASRVIKFSWLLPLNLRVPPRVPRSALVRLWLSGTKLKAQSSQLGPFEKEKRKKMEFVKCHLEKMKLWPVEHFWLTFFPDQC